ncbi:phosphatidylserine/phosphatidylglycerophosphate/cardiolipin synthase family protein [Croceicoccus sp. Ery5]|uniref:phospholipase D-like domain-containing protein n=1 Tax=Croceicoccus sp. Ery5 TaxID=1703340 RepID=UPI001E2B671F|nr:phosphatidylserine/phosphatidylglycerophosphate/cardiolipin synthase family protein [Croceicoccus sp. Ery5]
MTTIQPVCSDTPPYDDPPPFHVTAQGYALGFYPAGADRLQTLLSLIEGAQRSIRMCFYIFAEDEVSRLVRDALVAAARRGVRVSLILDDFGSSASEQFLEPLNAVGGRSVRFAAHWSQRYLIRNHQKIVVADDGLAMIGGFNIENDYFQPPAMNGWNDLAVTVEGEAVGALTRWYDLLLGWTGNRRARFSGIRRIVREWDAGSGPVRLLVGGPTKGLSSWARCVSADLIAGNRLDMMMAYFSPHKRLVRRIGRIAEKGETRLLMAGKSDNNATIGATRALYRYLLRHGARIWEFAPCKLHTKLIVLDDAVYLGSANFDMRSLYINLELMLRIEDAALADRMRDFVAQHLPASEAITPALHKQRSTLWNRFRWRLGWFLVAVMDYTVTRRLNLGL